MWPGWGLILFVLELTLECSGLWFSMKASLFLLVIKHLPKHVGARTAEGGQGLQSKAVSQVW